MIVPDVNLLVYAYNADAPTHREAKSWWEDLLNDTRQVGLAWIVMLGFVRLMTNARVLKLPLEAETAIRHVRSWLACPNTRVLEPGPQHLNVLESLLREAIVTADLTTDAHLAALAIECGGELHSSDLDFARFSGLRWKNPLRPQS